MTQFSVNIIRRVDDALVTATLSDEAQPSTLTAIEKQWKPSRISLQHSLVQHGIDRNSWPQSMHWDWNKKGPALKLLESNGFVLEYEGAIQGVMLTNS